MCRLRGRLLLRRGTDGNLRKFSREQFVKDLLEQHVHKIYLSVMSICVLMQVMGVAISVLVTHKIN